MQFGLLCSTQANSGAFGPETGQGFRAYLDFNVEAEALGFCSSFLVEHHFTGWNQVSATLMLLMGLAMRTTTLRLGTGVMVLPWHNPVLLAEQAATLDLLSGGRLDFGIGKGYRHNEFAGFGIPHGLAFHPMQVAVARQVYISKDQADTEAALARLARVTQRTIDVSRSPDAKSASHVLAYADQAGATEANALFGTPDEINGTLDAVRSAGAEYVLLAVSGGIEQLRRFKRDIMPNFATSPTV